MNLQVQPSLRVRTTPNMDKPDTATSAVSAVQQGELMARLRMSLTAAALAGAALLASAGPAAACRTDPQADPATWEYGGVYDCTKTTVGHGVRTYTKPSPVAFVVIRTGKTYFVSDLGDANEGDRTYTFDKPVRFVISCDFTDA
ncbi:hypothetical protein CTE05_10440 [Cellulomonas terrae]|uniref:Uncharacterized protein n=2 Tax=Cellulomonas terrae TaxID=311234 RepID=A0A511JHL9_9CELL|nr:hypothetical protein CTE05_10440 [Cellulomonas terrae]